MIERHKNSHTLTAAGLCLALLVSALLPTSAHANGRIYHADDALNRVRRAKDDGTIIEIINGTEVLGIGIDHIDGKIYYAKSIGQTIQRANLDGSGVETLLTAADGINGLRDLEVDPIGRKMYWIGSGPLEILRANLDGSNKETIIAAGMTDVRVIAIDSTNQKLYWADGGNSNIKRANLDGTNEELVVNGVVSIGIAIDESIGKLFWSEVNTNKIQRSNLDGTVVEDVRAFAPLSILRGIALDTQRGWIFFTSGLGASNVTRLTYDGAFVWPVLTPGGTTTSDIEFVDDLPPAIPVVLSPADGALFTSGIPTISGTAEANSVVEIFDGAMSLGTATTSGLGSWTFTPTSLADGVHSLTVTAKDPWLNTSAATAAITISTDITAPDVPVITSPVAGTDLIIGIPNFSGTAEANSTVNIYSNGILIGTVVADGTGAWSFTPGISFGPGNILLTVTATDGVGHISALSDSFEISVEPVLVNRTHFFWNGFLDLTNIMAVFNTSDTDSVNLNATLFDDQGIAHETKNFTIPARGEMDVIASDFNGFRANAIGSIEFAFNADTVDGSGFYYRSSAAGISPEHLEIVMGSNFENELNGNTFLNFNSMQPSSDLSETNNLVYNWVELLNLDESLVKNFTLEVYDLQGSPLGPTHQLSIPPRGRRDARIDYQLGGQHAGLVRIVPTDGVAGYKAALSRYGSNNEFESGENGYSFGIKFTARAGESSTIWAPISSGGNGQNWLVVTNVRPTGASIRARYLSNGGIELGNVVLYLAAYAQQHLEVQQLLLPGESGVVELTPLGGASIIADSTFYFRNPDTGRITAAYASEARRFFGSHEYSGYNNFLGQVNYIKLFNTGGTSTTVDLTVDDLQGNALGTFQLQLPANTGRDVNLEALSFVPGPNALGRVTVESSVGGTIYSELLRIRSLGNIIDSAVSIPIR